MAHLSVVETAAAWYRKLEEAERIEDEWETFEAWITKDPSHQAAFARIEDLWLTRRIFSNEDHDSILLTADGADVREEKLSWLKQVRSRVLRWSLIATVLVVCCVMVMPCLTRGRGLPETSNWEVFKTAIGERSHKLLADGSTADLDTDTTLRSSVTSGHREALLDQGEVAFQVASNVEQPFVVRAGEAHFQAQDTRFSVAYRAHELTMMVKSGTVEVCLPEAEPRLVGAAQIATITDHVLQVSQVTSAEMGRRTAWIHGELQFAGQSLEEAVQEFNRYNRAQLRIMDPAIGSLRVNGTYNPTNLQAFGWYLERSFGVRSLVRIDSDGETIELMGGDESR